MADLQQPDWRVPLVNTTPPRTVQDVQKEMATIAGLEAETRNRDAMAKANAAEAAQRERAMANANAMQRIWQESGGDWDTMIEKASALDPAEGAKLAEQRGKAQQATASAFSAQLTAEKQRTERGRMFLEVAQNDPEFYDSMVGSIAAMLPDELRAALPRTHDRARIAALLDATADAGKRMERAGQLHDKVLSGDAFKGVLGQLAEQDTEEEWNGVINTYAAFLPKGTLALLPKWGPDAQAKAAAMAMTPAEKADDARLSAAAAATAANQQFDNATARAQLDISRGHLGVAQAGLQLRRQELAQGGKESGRGDLVEAVLANPGLYDQITPTERGKIAGELQRRGFTGFGRPLSEGAAKQIAATDAAMQSLTDLREILKKNEQYIGPVAGLSALNPYSEARKAQADIDLVRQRVGKALEGGVLREHDEKKYKAILATLRDTPDTAIYKTDQLIKNLEIDKAAFIHQQRLTGRRVPQGEAPSAGAAQTSGTPTAKRQAQVGDIVKHPNGKRYRVVGISGNAADLEPID